MNLFLYYGDIEKCLSTVEEREYEFFIDHVLMIMADASLAELLQLIHLLKNGHQKLYDIYLSKCYLLFPAESRQNTFQQ